MPTSIAARVVRLMAMSILPDPATGDDDVCTALVRPPRPSRLVVQYARGALASAAPLLGPATEGSCTRSVQGATSAALRRIALDGTPITCDPNRIAIPGHAEGASLESRNPGACGFRARRFAASRNDYGEIFNAPLKVQLIADRDPAIGAATALHHAQAGERHVVAGDERPVGRRHVEHALARRRRLLLVVVDVELPVRPLERHDVVAAGVGPDQQPLALALDVVGHHAGRMAGHVDRADAARDLVARLDEAGTVGERHRDLDEQLAIELARLAHVLAALPEIELGRAEHVARIGKHRLAALGQP